MKIREGCIVKFLHNGRIMSCRLISSYREGQLNKLQQINRMRGKRLSSVHLEAPVGKALLGRVPGEAFQVETPGGPAEIQVLEVHNG